MENEDNIKNALMALQAGADENHAREMGLVREATRMLQRSNNEMISEIEHAMRQYEEGRGRLAEKLAEAAVLVGRLPVPKQMDALPDMLNTGNGGLPHETADDPLKLYDQVEGARH